MWGDLVHRSRADVIGLQGVASGEAQRAPGRALEEYEN